MPERKSVSRLDAPPRQAWSRVLCLAVLTGIISSYASGSRAETAMAKADPAVRFTDGGVGLLVSQIGYSLPGYRTAYLVSRSKASGDAVCGFSIEDSAGRVVASKRPSYVGQWVTAHFWRLDLSTITQPGMYRVRAGSLASQLFNVTSPKELYFDSLYRGMMITQLQMRRRDDSMAGFIDAGNDIRETNSHVTQMVGMLDMIELHRDWFSAQELSQIEDSFTHFADFLTGQQQASGQLLGGYWMGSQITFGSWPNHLLGTYGLVRLARHYAGVDESRRADLLSRARKALAYTDDHLMPSATISSLLSESLLAHAYFEAETGDTGAFENAKLLARELRARQVKQASPSKGGLYGLFRDPDGSLSRLNYHQANTDLNGEYWATPLEGLIALARQHGDDPDAELWRTIVQDYANGMLKKASSLSAMGLVANGEYADSVRWFSDLFHGMSMTYGISAASLVRYGKLLQDPSLYTIAEKQLLWIGGLNTGEGFPDQPQPFSCVVGMGYRWLVDGHGEFKGIPGSIVNGLSATPQFTRTVPGGQEQPSNLCDESWISHTGGWLSGAAELLSVTLPDASESASDPVSSCQVGKPAPSAQAGAGGSGVPAQNNIGNGGAGAAEAVAAQGGSSAAAGREASKPHLGSVSNCRCVRPGQSTQKQTAPLALMAALLVMFRRRRDR